MVACIVVDESEELLARNHAEHALDQAPAAHLHLDVVRLREREFNREKYKSEA
jgi:hypothetical protein